MNILFATSEAAPFCKTGGLGDVCGALPRELERLGHKPVVILPAFRQARQSGLPMEPTGVAVDVPIGQKLVRGHFLRSQLPNSNVPVFLLDQDDYYDRAQLYREEGEDYRDNSERFTFYCRAVLEAIPKLDLQVDVLHCHDWCSGLIPAYIKTLYGNREPWRRLVSLLTIHNLAYQGNFWHWDMALTGLDWKYFNWRQMEFYGNLSFLKTAVVFSDAITTVSPTYAKEILHPPLSCGFEGVLNHRAADLSGIINGVDYDVWNPATDRYLGDYRYSIGPHREGEAPAEPRSAYQGSARQEPRPPVLSYAEGKAACKRELQRSLHLPQRAETPLLAAIGRLADQKGFDLIVRVMQHWAERVDAQWVILGTGEPKYHEMLSSLAREFPDRVAVRLEFSDELAHRIEAAADIFVMPSQYEPCGLNQLYSLKYGTVPVVRATGGLVDTVISASDETISNRTATGFAFDDYTSLALSEALEKACRAYLEKPLWNQLIETGMQQDWSWRHSAIQYGEAYERTVQRGPLPIG